MPYYCKSMQCWQAVTDWDFCEACQMQIQLLATNCQTCKGVRRDNIRRKFLRFVQCGECLNLESCKEDGGIGLYDKENGFIPLLPTAPAYLEDDSDEHYLFLQDQYFLKKLTGKKTNHFT